MKEYCITSVAGTVLELLGAGGHGAHIDPANNRGTHGSDSPEDMDVAHFWKLPTP